ncbi:diacylglycerol/lipid kinase family protein [Erythrobacter alti]|uniref:diacylglycerol/lipid kinase family protein n=1 Tax=Erythrobacter alti TaxID=1896145 RepID=UPI0030F40983
MTGPSSPTDQPTVWLCYNSASGSHVDGLEEQIAERLAAADLNIARSFDAQSDELPDAGMASGAKVDVIIVHGGDGTLNGLVSRLIGWDGTILPLPGGTANLLCHELFEECEWDAILDHYAAGKLTPRNLKVLRCSEHIALAEMLVGPAALWADAREEIRNKEASAVIATATDAAVQSAEGPFVQIIEPEIGREEGYPGVRFILDYGAMKIEGYWQDGFLDFIKQGLAILTHDFRQGPHDDLGTAKWVVCRARDDAEIELMVDGERATISSTAEISYETLGIKVLASKARD